MGGKSWEENFRMKGDQFFMNGWIGIDPGATGAIAVIEDSGNIFIWDYPGDERALHHLVGIEMRVMQIRITKAVIESQQAMPGQGVSSTFKLGCNYGMWLMACASCNWPLETVRPAEWKRGLGYPAKDKKASKEHSLTLARRLYPQAARYLMRKMDHNRAEALLLAHYAKEGKG